MDDIVIVGGGLAAATAAETVRTDGFAGRVRLVTEEAERPYERPPLSKGVLSGTQAPEEVYVHSAEFYAEHDVELVVADPVVRIDRATSEAVTRAGRRLPFDRLLLATGAASRLLPFGAGDNLLTLRTLDDSLRLAERLRTVRHVTIVGAGWIGCEVAAAARGHGAQVTMVDPLEVPLARVLGVQVGALFGDLHAAHGVDLRLGTGVAGFRGGDTVEQVELGDGSVVDTELVVLGVGAGPRSELAGACGLDVDDGVVVDETLTSSDPRILAAGDVARAWHPFYGRHLRVEHWANAL
ncbi:MAG TPA: FAD-dependent oxidoreductase, partial [Egibacteraceae bacterium]